MSEPTCRRSRCRTDGANRPATRIPMIGAFAYALLREWWRRYRSRQELALYSRHEWNDIGSAANVDAEIDKPFWKE
jgi:uncharacterized protein YjiS (DUF1127 family)